MLDTVMSYGRRHHETGEYRWRWLYEPYIRAGEMGRCQRQSRSARAHHRIWLAEVF